MKHAVLAIALLLTGCATTTPVRTTVGTWMVSARVPFTGQSGALGHALAQANAFCNSQGEVAEVASTTSKECMLHGGCGEAQITFICSRENTKQALRAQ